MLPIVCIVLLLCCCGGLTAAKLLKDSVGEAFGPVREDASAFMDDVVRDDTTAAYRKLCSASKDRYSEQQFADRVHRFHDVRGYKIVNSFVSNVNGTTSARVTVQVEDSTGGHEVELGMVKEGDGWKVCGDPF